MPVARTREALLKPAKLAVESLALVVRQALLEGAQRRANAADRDSCLVDPAGHALDRRNLVAIQLRQGSRDDLAERLTHRHVRIEWHVSRLRWLGAERGTYQRIAPRGLGPVLRVKFKLFAQLQGEFQHREWRTRQQLEFDFADRRLTGRFAVAFDRAEVEREFKPGPASLELDCGSVHFCRENRLQVQLASARIEAGENRFVEFREIGFIILEGDVPFLEGQHADRARCGYLYRLFETILQAAHAQRYAGLAQQVLSGIEIPALQLLAFWSTCRRTLDQAGFENGFRGCRIKREFDF